MRRAVCLPIAALAVASLTGCEMYRTIRWGAPPPERQEEIFANRIVARADSPFHFVRVAERADLDTITVRAWDGREVPWAQYMDDGRMRAFVVIRNDTILYERYGNGIADSTRIGAYSMAKSVTSALLGVALGDGEIRSLDEHVALYVPALDGHPAYDDVTLRHALEMRTGIDYRRAMGSLWNDLRSHDARYYYTRNLDRALAGMRRASAPGGDWDYRDSDTQLLAAVLARATGRSLAEQLQDRIWRRIGAEFDASWSLDRAGGTEKAAVGVNAAARDYARFARLFLHGGSWNGEQVVPREWVERSTTLDTTRTRPEVGTWWRMQHRTLWWIPMHDWEAHRDFFADGAKGQRLYVHPRTGTIIVQLADSDYQDFPFRRIAHYMAGLPYEYPGR